jgi:hypothetical protein
LKIWHECQPVEPEPALHPHAADRKRLAFRVNRSLHGRRVTRPADCAGVHKDF